MNRNIDDRDGWIWMNGEMVPWRKAHMHVLTHGMHYGGCVFEGERAYDGQIFKLREHSERLIRSAELLDILVDYSAEDLDNFTMEVVKANSLTSGYIRPFIWRGSERMGLIGSDCKVNVAIAMWPWPKYFSDSGISLETSKWRRMHPSSFPVQSKASGVYSVGTMAKHAAMRNGYDDALMLDYKGDVAEASVCNIFCVTKDGTLQTPIPESFLNGITRQTVISICKDLNLKLEETTIKPEDLEDYAEIFVTGTAAEITPIGKIDRTEYQIGDITKRIQCAYKDLVHTKL